MAKYKCDLCDYVYDEELGDPARGVKPGTVWGNVPSDWVCPECGAPKEMFKPLE